MEFDNVTRSLPLETVFQDFTKWLVNNNVPQRTEHRNWSFADKKGRERIKTTPESSYSCVHRHWPIALSSRSVNQWCHIQWKPSPKLAHCVTKGTDFFPGCVMSLNGR
ncbi:hypothetical protein T01_7532 [Trichinella spiralis]|uniref:Uncharacterized protein n=1 Tax=Trichinella spiralis TaxID=6334 RepID=A0A0V1BE26_TRISP|nr:hypothetical protein T01_7532 [Trichinella spiralis]